MPDVQKAITSKKNTKTTNSLPSAVPLITATASKRSYPIEAKPAIQKREEAGASKLRLGGRKA